MVHLTLPIHLRTHLSGATAERRISGSGWARSVGGDVEAWRPGLTDGAQDTRSQLRTVEYEQKNCGAGHNRFVRGQGRDRASRHRSLFADREGKNASQQMGDPVIGTTYVGEGRDEREPRHRQKSTDYPTK